MKPIIVPVDFSETAMNAARYAAEFSNVVKGTSLILFNSFDKILAGSDGSPLFSDPGARMDLSMAALENLKAEIYPLTAAKIECVAAEGELVANLRSLVKRTGSELIIMGITGSSRLDQLLIGSNTLSLISQDIAPVLIVPPAAKFKGIKNVVYSSDFKNVDKTTPLAPIRSFLQLTGAGLHVVNVDSEHHIELTEEYKAEKAKLNSMLSEFKPEYYFIRIFDFTDAISTFSEGHDIDVIITVPRKHSFLESLFKSSHTKKLAYHSHIPILAIHG